MGPPFGNPQGGRSRRDQKKPNPRKHNCIDPMFWSTNLLSVERGWLTLAQLVHLKSTSVLQILSQGPRFYLLHEALRKKVPFKALSSNFKNCCNLPEVAKSDESSLKPKTRKGTKRMKTDDEAGGSSENIQPAVDDEELEDQDFQSTYILTMSESVLKDLDESSREESILTPFTQVFSSVESNNPSSPSVVFRWKTWISLKCVSQLRRLKYSFKPLKVGKPTSVFRTTYKCWNPLLL